MSHLAQQDFTQNLFALLQETFENGGNFYLAKDAGVFPTLETIPAEVASREPYPGAPTIVAHCAHLDYYIRANHDAIIGREQELDWPSSWRVRSAGVGEWEALKGRLRNGYEDLKVSLKSLPAWGDDSVCDSIAIVAHSAYHLGAIRQIQRLLAAHQRSSPPGTQPG